MTVTYIGHSGFSVELERCTLLFDYYQGAMPDFDPDKKLYVFASHAHHDHFVPAIFELRGRYDVTYILSDDIRASGEDILFLGPDQTALTGGLTVETLRSTDEGVAFSVTVGETRVYHAGDLNLWVWDEEGPEWNAQMERDYPAFLRPFDGRRFDLAFLPLDPRQEQDRERGLLGFLEHCQAEHIFPMHMWDDYSVIPALLAHHPELKDRVAVIEAPGQVFEL